MIQELEQIQAAVAENTRAIAQLSDSLRREQQARMELEAQLRSVAAAVAGPPAKSPHTQPQPRHETTPAYALLAMAMFMLVVVLLVLRKLSQLEQLTR
jgi:uncharacterized protein YoxC